MGLLDKITNQGPKTKAPEMLTEKEVAFVVSKLRQATYQGSEFEAFYSIMSKLQQLVETKIK